MYYINIFFIYSFLGFLFENFLTLFLTHSQFNSGVLYGPWTFIYGVAIFAIMFLNRFLKKYKLHPWLEVLLFYLSATVIMTFIEFSGGVIIEKLFHVVYWNYTNMHFNIGNYICLEVALFWGLFATLINYFVAPTLKKFAYKIPKYVTIAFASLFVIDIITTIIN